MAKASTTQSNTEDPAAEKPWWKDLLRLLDVYHRVFVVLVAATLVLYGLAFFDVISATPANVLNIILLVPTLTLMLFFLGEWGKRSALVLVILTSLWLAPESAPEHGTREFYSAAAQVIPVLLLVLAIEARLFRISIRRPTRRTGESISDYRRRVLDEITPLDVFGAGVAILTVLVLISGELQALTALADDEPKAGDARPVFTAITVGLVVVGYLALVGIPRPPANSADHRAAHGAAGGAPNAVAQSVEASGHDEHRTPAPHDERPHRAPP